MEPTGLPDLPPPLPAHPPWYRGLGRWSLGVLAGAAIIALGSAYEQWTKTPSPLDDAILVLLVAGNDLPDGLGEAINAGTVLPVTLYQLESAEDALPMEGPLAEFADMVPRQWLLTAEGDAAAQLITLLEPHVASGALPGPGEHALAAGPGMSQSHIELGGHRFAVAANLDREAGMFHGMPLMFAPLPPESAEAARETRNGYFAIARDTFRDAVPLEEREVFTLHSGLYFAPAMTILLAILGLIIVAIAGSIVWIRLMQNLAGRGGRLLRPAFDACRDEGPLLIGTHAILYGTFFAMMFLGLVFTDAYVLLLTVVREIFASGPLKDIGEAYESGNIIAAKFETWRHNYLFATVLVSALPSLFVPGAALVKNMVSFALLGFVLVPVMADSAFVMSFHSITMWLELEAYILVSFAAVLLPIKVLRALLQRGGDVQKAYIEGAKILGSMTLFVGGLLLVAALYEATTLILLR